MYVAPEARGNGLGNALLDHAVEHARALPGIEEAVSWVIAGNRRAEALHLSAGFEDFCVEPRVIKVGDQKMPSWGCVYGKNDG
jgi:L-amino acid N-acyltransferase YncA